jgi:radical SAM superfamily enzyme YgiQ (UPF0313 family)
MQPVFGDRKSTGDIFPPLGLAYIASYLRKHDIDVEILDANALDMPEDKVVEFIKSKSPSVIGFTTTTIIMPTVMSICEKIKSNSNLVIVGGPHVSAIPEETLHECAGIDMVVVGEGEITLLELLNRIENGRSFEDVEGLVYRKDGRIVRNPPRPFIHDLDSLDFPALDMLPIEKYRPAPIIDLGYSGKEFATIITARGCTGKCVFCASSGFWKRIRLRSAANILEEVDRLVKRGVKHIMIVDDTFTCYKKRVVEFCHAVIERRYNIVWNCYARVNDIDEEIIDVMKEAGCFFIFFGVESGSQEMLNRIKKFITLEQVGNAVRLTKQAGIMANCAFMMGHPGETYETMKVTLDFAIKLNPHIAEFYITTPFPGTELYEMCKSEGWLEGHDWRDFTIHKKANLRTCDIPAKEIENYVKYAYKRFYTRPEFMLLSFKQMIMNPKSIKLYINCIGIYANSVLKNRLP